MLLLLLSPRRVRLRVIDVLLLEVDHGNVQPLSSCTLSLQERAEDICTVAGEEGVVEALLQKCYHLVLQTEMRALYGPYRRQEATRSSKPRLLTRASCSRRCCLVGLSRCWREGGCSTMSGTVERELSIAEGGGANNTSLGLLCVRRSFFCRRATAEMLDRAAILSRACPALIKTSLRTRSLSLRRNALVCAADIVFDRPR